MTGLVATLMATLVRYLRVDPRRAEELVESATAEELALSRSCWGCPSSKLVVARWVGHAPDLAGHNQIHL